jgi:nicotinate-nucleotide adenylyltransferase
MKLGVYIGSFNPVHNGHIKLVNFLLDNNYLDKVLIVATNGYWNKNDLVDINSRIEMLKFFQNENIIIDETHNDYPYTYELMNALSNEYKNDELYLIMGADNIINFDKWMNYEELLNYKIIVMNRNNIDINSYIKKYNTSNFIVVNDFDFIDVSSTKIRSDLNNPYLDKRVLKYIKKNNLYKEVK